MTVDPSAEHGQVNAVLNQLVREGTLTGFRTNFADRKDASWRLEATVSVPDVENAGEALRRAREVLEPLHAEMTVVLDLRENG